MRLDMLNALTVKIHVPAQGGLYRLVHPQADELLYIGQSGNLQARLGTHARTAWADGSLANFCALPPDTSVQQRHEAENDLIAAFYQTHQAVPQFQFMEK
jgi:hypothetical protein